MDQHMKQWLKKNGHQNVFAFYTKQQCEEMASHLEEQLATEQQLEQAAREVVKHSQLAFTLSETAPPLPSITTTWMAPEIKEPPVAGEEKPTRRTEPIIAEPSEPPGPSPTLSAQSGVSRLSISLVGMLGLLVWSSALYQFAFQQGKQQHTRQQNDVIATHCQTPGTSQQVVQSKSLNKVSPTTRPLFSTPLLIQPSLRVEIATTHPSLRWKEIVPPSRTSWNTSQTPIISAELSQQPATSNSPWLMPSISRFKLNRRHSKPTHQREFFRLPPLQLTNTTF